MYETKGNIINNQQIAQTNKQTTKLVIKQIINSTSIKIK